MRRIHQVGRKQWKQESGYHRRSLSDVSSMSYKARNFNLIVYLLILGGFTWSSCFGILWFF
ncbi:hypothetical protein IQ259_12760 [Fortiea sp. LEGE XX443]|uniref:hypothetical protein n=1 Tax=Fortiea sp. LEGE XX443 TaxID=1828611 RepID=UPI0018809210|nr:hypothetical protein [Fortiea sp. LEGE XX443]MBE9005896.1 hypothetical protein [Fortiea sp. LEGE XX443]